mmetsp:Transcript_86694/g.280110  ORF Transcript_86694/g.280110 Transcript_86694/m.280110 type:complete len:317 (+) Transcript_86694:555-1505(+)
MLCSRASDSPTVEVAADGQAGLLLPALAPPPRETLGTGSPQPLPTATGSPQPLPTTSGPLPRPPPCAAGAEEAPLAGSVAAGPASPTPAASPGVSPPSAGAGDVGAAGEAATGCAVGVETEAATASGPPAGGDEGSGEATPGCCAGATSEAAAAIAAARAATFAFGTAPVLVAAAAAAAAADLDTTTRGCTGAPLFTRSFAPSASKSSLAAGAPLRPALFRLPEAACSTLRTRLINTAEEFDPMSGPSAMTSLWRSAGNFRNDSSAKLSTPCSLTKAVTGSVGAPNMPGGGPKFPSGGMPGGRPGPHAPCGGTPAP